MALRIAFVLEALSAIACLVLFFVQPHAEVLAGVTHRLLSVFPFFFACYLHLEYPPPGNGVGKAAGPLPKLQQVVAAGSTSKSKSAAAKEGKDAKDGSKAAKPQPPQLPPLGKDGALLAGHAYVITFFNTSPACLKPLIKVDKLHRNISACKDWLHLVLISHEEEAKLKGLLKRLGGLPIAADPSGEATTNYLVEHSAYVAPHVFVVGLDGIILWHGQINRKELISTIADLIRQKVSQDAAAIDAAKKES